MVDEQTVPGSRRIFHQRLDAPVTEHETNEARTVLLQNDVALEWAERKRTEQGQYTNSLMTYEK